MSLVLCVALLTITGCETDQVSGISLEPSAHKTVHRGQLVLLKADDLRCCPITPNWNRFLQLLAQREIAVGVGIIAFPLESASYPDVRVAERVLKTGLVELWNHGYQHSCEEFRGTDLKFQERQLRSAQRVVTAKFGVTMRAFGAPCNAFDDITVQAIDRAPYLHAWIFGSPKSAKTVIPRTIEAEFPLFHPNAAKFQVHYDSLAPYFTLQIHPGKWDDAGFREFAAILDFLAERDVQFVTPTAMARAIERRDPTPGDHRRSDGPIPRGQGIPVDPTDGARRGMSGRSPAVPRGGI